MLEAIRIRLRADVGVGIYLSGGLDSSALAGMAAKLVQEGNKLGNDTSGEHSRISCFTVQFDKDSGLDESGMSSLFLLLDEGIF
jgi:asparagine synthase (glutamine-hydrolysing)